MNEYESNGDRGETAEIIVKASSIDGVLDVLNAEPGDSRGNGADDVPAVLEPVVGTLSDALGGLRAATREDPRGRSRKKVRAYADREDVPGDRFGHHLRVLEHHGLAECDGNRWRLATDGVDG